MSYQWNSFTVIDEKQIGDGNLNTGDSFVYDGAHAEMWVYDNDHGLAGDRGANEQGSDWQPGYVYEDNTWENAGNVYWEGYFVMRGSDGRNYYLIEIEGTCLDNSQDYFAFYGAVPPQGVTLTATCYYNDCGSLSYNCLDGGELGDDVVAPDAVNDFLSVSQNEGQDGDDINVLLNDASNTGDALVVKGVDGSAALVGVWVDLDNGGKVLIAADGSVDFDADGDFDALGEGQTATVSINYTVLNTDGLEDTATLTIEVTGINDAPVAVDQAVRTDEETPVTGNLLNGAFDVDGETVELGQVVYNGQPVEIGVETSVVTLAGYTGTLLVESNGDFTFTPGPDANALNQGDVDQLQFQFTVISGGVSGENLIVNGEFENNDLNNSGWGTYTSIEGWTATDGRIEVQEGTYGAHKAHGDAVVELDSHYNANGDNNSTMEQTVTVSEAGNFTLSVDYAPRQAPDGQIASTSGISVLVNGVVVMELVSDVVAYETYTIDVDLPAGDNVVAFQATGTDDTYGGRIDSVSLVQNGQGALESEMQTATVIIDGISGNTPPSVQAQVATTDENTTVFGDLLDGATDAEGDDITLVSTEFGAPGSYSVTTDGGRTGTLEVTADGLYSFTPDGIDLDLNETDTITFEFTATDGEFNSSATATITITGLNEAPTVVSQSLSTNEQNAAGLSSSVSGDILDGAADADGDVVSLASVSVGTIGSTVSVTTTNGGTGDLTVNADGTFSFVSTSEGLNTGEQDTLVIDFTAESSGGVTTQSAAGQVTITINGVNVDPVAVDIAVSGDEQSFDGSATAITGDLLAGSSDADGDAISLSSTSLGAIGSTVAVTTTAGNAGELTINADGTFSFLSLSGALDLGETDSVVFTYTVESADGAATRTDTAQATITINGLNEAPTVENVAVSTNEANDEGLNASVSGSLLMGASDADGDAISLQSVSVGAIGSTTSVTTDGGNTGELTVNADGSFTFVSTSDNLDLGETDTLTIDFTGVSTGGVTEQTGSAQAVITINGVNVAPVAMSQAFAINEQNAIGFQPTAATGNLLDGATDADGDTVTLASVSVGEIGETVVLQTQGGRDVEFTVNADGTFTVQSIDDSMDITETDSFVFSFVVESSGGVTTQQNLNTVQVTVDINGVNVAPVAAPVAVSVNEANDQGFESTVSGDLLEGATDADGDVVSLQSITIDGVVVAAGSTISVTTDNGGTGDLTVNADGTFTYVSTSDGLDQGVGDSYSFDFTVESSGGVITRTDTATATIDISGVNAAPVAINQIFTTPEDANAVGALLTGATDADGDAVTFVGANNATTGAAYNLQALPFIPVMNTVTTAGGYSGQLSISTSGALTFMPGADLVNALNDGETDTFTFNYSVQSNGGEVDQFDTASATIVITGITPNGAPVAELQEVAILENEVATGDLNDVISDPDGDALSITEINGQAVTAGADIALTSDANGWDGTLVVEADGTYSFTPGDSFLDLNDGQSELVTFSYTTSDGNETASNDVVVTVNGISDDPVDPVDPDEGNDVNVIYLFDASATMFAPTVDCDGDGVADDSLIDLATAEATQIQANIDLLYDVFQGQTVDDDYYFYGNFAQEVADPADVSQTAGASDLAAALSTLTLDTTKETRIYIFTNDVNDAAGVGAAGQSIVDAFATAGTSLSIDGVAMGIQGSGELLSTIEGLELIDTDLPDLGGGLGGGLGGALGDITGGLGDVLGGLGGGLGDPVEFTSLTVDIIATCDSDLDELEGQRLIDEFTAIS